MKQYFKNMRIQNKIMLCFLAVCLVPVIVVSILIYRFSARSMEETAMEFVSVFNAQLVSNLNEFIEGYDRVTKSMLVDEEVIRSLGDEDSSVMERIDTMTYLRKVMQRLMTLRPAIDGIALVARDGTFYQTAAGGSSMDYEVMKTKSWYQEMAESGETLYLTEVHNGEYYDKSQDRIVVTIARRIYDYSGRYTGMVLIDLNPSELVALNEDFLRVRNTYEIVIQVMNEKGKILYDSDVMSGVASWSQVMREDRALPDANAKEYITMSNTTSRANLVVNAVIPRIQLLKKIDRIYYMTVGIVLFVAFLIFVMSAFLSRTLSRPLENLQENMLEAEKGNYQLMLYGEGTDEVGSLVRSYNNMIREIKILIEDVYLAEIKKKNAEYLALQTQINPHMLYNTLESIRMKALMQGADDTAEMIKTLSRMFRMALNLKMENGSVQDEISYTEAYVQLMQIRYRDRICMDIHVPEEMRHLPMISLIFQPVVENSIEHGFRNRKNILHVTISGAVEAGKMKIQISDDGCGMTEERLKEVSENLLYLQSEDVSLSAGSDDGHSSIGLQNIAERIRLYYGEDGRLSILSSENCGTKVELFLPVKTGKGEGQGAKISSIDC